MQIDPDGPLPRSPLDHEIALEVMGWHLTESNLYPDIWHDSEGRATWVDTLYLPSSNATQALEALDKVRGATPVLLVINFEGLNTVRLGSRHVEGPSLAECFCRIALEIVRYV